MLRSTSVMSLPNPSNLRSRILLAGLTFLASSSLTLSAYAAPLQAAIRSGQQPIAGSLVVLFASGATGYGSKPKILDFGYSDFNGNVNLVGNYTCPASPKDQVYLVAAGGNAGGGYNLNLSLMAGLGSCSKLTPSTFVVVNEVSTVAAAYALSPFMTTAPEVGTSATNYQGLVNGFATIGNLVNSGTGQALTITPAYAAAPVASLNTSTVPQSRINTLADILAACVNSNGVGGSSTVCATLFAAATPPGGTAPTNTLQAGLNIAQNPGTNAAALYALSSPSAPFQPTLTAAPNDWQLAVTYTGAGLGLAPGATVGDVGNTALAIDAIGNLWVTAYGVQGGEVVPDSSMIAEFNNLGASITPPTTQPTPSTVSYGGFMTTPLNIIQPIAIAIDEAGKAWVSGTSDYIDAISPSLTPALPAPIYTNVLGPVTSFAIDSLGDVWTAGGQSGTGVLSEYSNRGVLLSPSTGYTGGGSYGENYYGNLSHLTFDSTGNNLWASDSQFGDFYRISTATGQLVFDYFPTGGTLTALAAGASGNIFGCPTGPSSLQAYNSSSNTAIATYPTTTGRGCGSQLTVDGAGNIWVTGSSALDEYSSTGVRLSPAAGFTATSNGEAPTYPSAVGSGVDSSGNVWVLNGSTGSSPSNPNNVLVELVGAAAPVVSPIALALADGKVAARP